MSEPKQRVTAERACMEMNRIEELLATTKLNDMMHKKDDDQKTTVLWILAIIGAVAAVAAIALAAFHNFGVEYNGVRNIQNCSGQGRVTAIAVTCGTAKTVAAFCT